MACTRIMDQIEHVVLLMLENRSLDNLFGWLYENDAPKRVIPEGSDRAFDGLTAGEHTNIYKGQTLAVMLGTESAAEPFRIPRWDPREPLDDVTVQLFGDAEGIVDRLLQKNADDRYASSAGLLHDLETCRDEMGRTGTVRPFGLAQNDVTSQFRPSVTLFSTVTSGELLK